MVEKKSTAQIPPKCQGLSITIHPTFKAQLRPCRTVYLILQMKIAKVQPRYAQSVSNFQAEYLEATKMVIQSFTNFQTTTLIKFSWIKYDNRSTLYSYWTIFIYNH